MIGDRWGVTGEEIERRYPCDDFVSKPSLQAWRGVTINATSEQTWSRLLQVRLAPYSYDWIDNLGRPSPPELRNLCDPRPGDAFTAAAGRPLGRIICLESGVHLTARIIGATLTYQLIPAATNTTRLILKIVLPGPRPAAQLLCLGDLVMARRQLLNFKRLTEADSRGMTDVNGPNCGYCRAE